jgi:periplasmic protein CpxP/Spy
MTYGTSHPHAKSSAHDLYRGPRRRLASAALAGALLAAGVLTVATQAAAQASTPPAPAPATAAAPGPAKAAPSAPGGMAGMGDKLDQTLSKVGATPDQKAKIQSIALTAMGSLMALKPKVTQTPGQLQRLLTGPTVDRAGLEQLRLGLVADLDQASKTLFAALADAADTLTPEQRAKLAAQLAPKPKPKS